MRLKGRVALVTGAGSGFGAGIARRFAEEGAQVVVNDISPQGEKVAKEVGGKFVQADVTKSADWARMVREAGDLSIVVNNAGWTHRNRPYLEVSEADFDKVYAINVNVFWVRSSTVEISVIGKVLKPGGTLHLFYEGPDAARTKTIASRVGEVLGGHGWESTVTSATTGSTAIVCLAAQPR